MKLSDLVRNYRTEHDLSQRQFAIMCDLSNGTVSNLEKGINPNTGKPITPSVKLLKKIASAMGITLTEMLEALDDMPIDISGDTIPTADGTNFLRMAARDGTYIERYLSDTQFAELRKYIDNLPDASEDI